jgi:hypothetical protein
MNYYYDCEFLEGTQDKMIMGLTKPTIDLISIGIVAEDGREYYAISKDFNLKEAWNRYDLKVNKNYPSGPEHSKVYWIRENVLKPIFYEWKNKDINFHEINFTYKDFKRLLKKYGKSNKQIAEEIIGFVYPEHEAPKFYGYNSAYDHVALCWLFGKMIDLPKGFPMYTIDLQQIKDDINRDAITLVDIGLIPEGYFLVPGTFSERYLKVEDRKGYPKQTNEHNALADARWNFELYKFFEKL